MYKKFLVVASKIDKAGVNITTQLSQFRKNPVLTSMSPDKPGFDFYLTETDIIDDKGVNHEKFSQYDFIIFASKHESSKKEKTLSVHSVGNWRNADFGGEKEKLCPSSALFQKFMFQKLKENADKHNMKEYKITLECTHHGPLIDKPCLFIEIGATDTEWNDRRAAFVIAKTISDTIEEFKPNPYNEIAIGIGGPHYCPNFNKIQLNSNFAVSHIIPQYVLPLGEEMIKQAIEKTQEEIDFVLLDWKGLGKADQRQQILDILDENHIPYKRISEVSK